MALVGRVARAVAWLIHMCSTGLGWRPWEATKASTQWERSLSTWSVRRENSAISASGTPVTSQQGRDVGSEEVVVCARAAGACAHRKRGGPSCPGLPSFGCQSGGISRRGGYALPEPEHPPGGDEDRW